MTPTDRPEGTTRMTAEHVTALRKAVDHTDYPSVRKLREAAAFIEAHLAAPATSEPRSDDTKRLDFLEKLLYERGYSVSASPPSGMRKEPEFLIHGQGAGYLAYEQNVRAAIDAAMRTSEDAAPPSGDAPGTSTLGSGHVHDAEAE